MLPIDTVLPVGMVRVTDRHGTTDRYGNVFPLDTVLPCDVVRVTDRDGVTVRYGKRFL